ncbi:MAG: 30S ribosomal protein S13 [Candidatus Shikimatogenerans sp. AspAUS03]|uniref:Small ribosomal subunit protein uS13 n=1 Tax=Candidatus Shikimatogenerans sp. AspAUS03 TaxID=3158563 RepID=A0AAU7QSH0_9FLAO
MFRILGVLLEENKKVYIALTKIFGIGKNSSIMILKKLNININKKTKELKEKDFIKIQNYIEKKFIIENDLRINIKLNIKYLKDINCYRGVRHKLNLPVRGQKTKNNCRTRKGKKKTVANKKKILKK